MLELDIATRVVGPAEDFYIVRPGAEFVLYDEFLAQSHIFLDFPGVGLNPQRTFPDIDVARAMVTRAVAFRDWHRSGSTELHPVGDLRAYTAGAKGKRIGKYVGALKRLHFELPKGTLVIVPGPGYFSDVLIGEIVSDNVALEIAAYPGDAIIARRVKWLGRKQKARLSPALIDALKNRNPLTALARSLREEILAIAFDQYILNDTFTARLRTSDDDFNTLNDYDIQSFLNYVAGTLAIKERGDADDFSVSLMQAISALRNNRDLVPELASNINSPGFLRLFGSSTAPIAIIVLLTAALSGVPVTADDLSIVNSMAPVGDACTLQVEDQVKGALQLMRIDDWQQACEQAQHAGEDTGLETSVRARVIHSAVRQ